GLLPGRERSGRASGAATRAGLFRRDRARSGDHVAVPLLDRARRLRSHGPDPCRLRPYVVVVQASAEKAAPQREAVRADRARLAGGAHATPPPHSGVATFLAPRGNRDFL